MGIRNFRDLQVWQGGMALVMQCYRLTENFPSSELYGLVSQIRRAAVSIPSNIAEGHGRSSVGDYMRHLSYARGSLTELETQLCIARQLDFMDEANLTVLLEKTEELGRMLTGLTKRLRKLRSRQRT